LGLRALNGALGAILIKQLLAASGLVWCTSSALALGFTPGHLYSTSDTAINEYDATGRLLSSLPAGPGGELRGLAFGRDGLLYVVRDDPVLFRTASVQALKDDGTVVRTYTFSGTVFGNGSFGKITFDHDGNRFYVGASNGVYRFDTAVSTGTLFASTEAFDVEVLPNGEILALGGYELRRYSDTGTLLNTVTTLLDPLGITGGAGPWLVDARGVEFDAATNRTFVSMLGYSSVVPLQFKVLALDGNSNRIADMADYWYADDLFVGQGQQLLVGSWTQSPGIFSTELDPLGRFDGPSAQFVTALPVPEPGALALWLLGLPALLLAARRMS
jgi:hypothetical protein